MNNDEKRLYLAKQGIVTHEAILDAAIKYLCFVALGQGRKIEAIKDWRTVTNCSLKESKDAIEYYVEKIKAHYPSNQLTSVEPRPVMVSLEQLKALEERITGLEVQMDWVDTTLRKTARKVKNGT